MAVLESLAARDLTQSLDVDSTDEFGMMAVALNHTHLKSSVALSAPSP